MWTYEQSTGKLFTGQGPGRVFVWAGYSGRSEGLNNATMQDVPNEGPLPQGLYTIGSPYAHPHLGPVCMNLQPDLHNLMFGRGDFRIHADNAAKNQSASEGCIVMPYAVRIKIGQAVVKGDAKLDVTA